MRRCRICLNDTIVQRRTPTVITVNDDESTETQHTAPYLRCTVCGTSYDVVTLQIIGQTTSTESQAPVAGGE